MTIANDRVMLGRDCDMAPDIAISVAPAGKLVIGDRTSIRRGTTIEVSRGATVVIGRDVTIGEHVFIASMVGLYVGDGVGISNMVDIHDHNHRRRTFENLPNPDEWTPYASGFDGAPIMIQRGAILSNKSTVLAGCHVGANTVVGANAVVGRSLPPNAIAVGAPARVVRRFQGPFPDDGTRYRLRLAFFGTSLMEHLEGFAPRLTEQWNLPSVGSSVVVEGHRQRGYPLFLRLALQADHPHIAVRATNVAHGGATSRDVLDAVRAAGAADERLDLALVGCGINDAWRRLQGRLDEAVDPVEYESNYAAILEGLNRMARQVIVVGEPPTALPEAAELNPELQRYNVIARRQAAARGLPFVDVWDEFLLAGCGGADGDTTPWADGVHLSEVGDALVLRCIRERIAADRVVEDLLQYELFDRHEALQRHGATMAALEAALCP